MQSQAATRLQPSLARRCQQLLPAVLLLFATTVRGDEFRPTAQETIVPPGAELTLLWDEGEFTEGPAVAPSGAILFSDIGNRIMRYEPQSGEVTVFRPASGKANGLMFDRQGRLIACEGAAGGNRRVSITDRPEKSGTIENRYEGKRRHVVHALADRYQGKRFNSPNDLAIDPQGRVYFTDPRYGSQEGRELDFEGVFLVDADGHVKLATRDIAKPNGILVSQDGRTVYVADNESDPAGNHHLAAFRVQPDGTLADKRILFDFGPNRRGIDGMTLDERGNIYATAGRDSEAGVYVFDPTGKPLAFIATPGTPTNCVFGGPSEPTALYITAGVPLEGDQPQRFGLYRIELAVPGHHISADDTRAPSARPDKWSQPVEIAGVPNLHKVSESLYRSGQPTAEGMRNLKARGVATIVNLRSFHSDRDEIGETGLAYEHIYMKPWHPEDKEAVRFLQVVTDERRTPVLVHCMNGSDRAGAMCAVYRIAVQGWTKEEAINEMVNGGYGFSPLWRNLVAWVQELDVEDIGERAGLDRK